MIRFVFSLRSVAIVVPQHAGEPLAAFDLARELSDFISRIDDLVFESLVVALGVIVVEIMLYSSQRICENTRDYYYLRSECP